MSTMKTISFSLLVTAVMLFGSGTAFAQATRTWVSGVGDDVNPCSRTAPCKTFAGAMPKTADGGEINCIDSGAYGAVTITKSMTIDCEDHEAGVLHSATNGIIVNGAGIDVVLRGLDINGGTPSAAGLNGIRFLQGNSLIVDDCVIHNSDSNAAPNGNGIQIAPSAGLAKVQVINSRISGNGAGTAGAGIQVNPSGTGSVVLSVVDTDLLNNTVGLRADSSGTSGGIKVSAVDSTASGATYHGFVALGTGGPVLFMLDRVTVSGNAGEGLRAVGANALIRIGNSVVTANGIGIVPTAGGVIQTYGGNQLDGNTSEGAPSYAVPLR